MSSDLLSVYDFTNTLLPEETERTLLVRKNQRINIMEDIELMRKTILGPTESTKQDIKQKGSRAFYNRLQ